MGSEGKIIFFSLISIASTPIGMCHPRDAPAEPDAGELPPGWKRKWSDRKQRWFYQNKVTGTSSWHRPKR